MARQWYTAIGSEQAGPYSDERFLQLVAAGIVRADTFVWCNGMKDWARAGEIPGLMQRPARPAPQPAQPQAPRAAAPREVAQRKAALGQGAGQALSADLPMWPLLGRVLLVVIGQILVIPAPWTTTSFYRWFVDHIELPNWQRAKFTGRPGDIWYIFMANAALAYSGFISGYLPLLSFLLTTFFLVLILRWFWQNLAREGQAAPLKFTGDYLHMLGWYVLTIVSVISIVGWAWVSTAWIRWICRHVEGSDRQLIFTASGLDLLWRSLAFLIASVFIVPIPWTLHWYARWLVSQFALSNERVILQ